METQTYNCKKCGLTISSTCSKCDRVVDVKVMDDLEGKEDVVSKIDEGVKIIAGQRSDTAEVGRKYTKRLMPI